jgi:short-subunit dehydrogenase
MKKHNITSYNIFGITGGIGFEFYKLIRNNKLQISGYFNSNNELAKKLDIPIFRIDLTQPQDIDYSIISNFEGLLYVAGKPFIFNSIFQIDNQNIIDQVNINITSLITVINSLLQKKDSKLKKIVIVTSKIPQNKSIYHLSKHLQEVLLNFISDELDHRKISVSIIRTGWVNTNMLTQYIKETNDTPSNYYSTSFIAKKCYNEFLHNKPLKIIEL